MTDLANDNGAAYAPDNSVEAELRRIYQAHSSADAAALRLAQRVSPSKLARRAVFVSKVYVPVELGRAFEATILPDGYGVREVPAAELARRMQSGLRGEIDRLLEEAERSAARARELLGSSFAARHIKESAEYRRRARALETQLTVNVARAV